MAILAATRKSRLPVNAAAATTGSVSSAAATVRQDSCGMRKRTAAKWTALKAKPGATVIKSAAGRRTRESANKVSTGYTFSGKLDLASALKG